jgi:ABC-type nitrate/sulfonate/bicarbonate transport system permease component
MPSHDKPAHLSQRPVHAGGPAATVAASDISALTVNPGPRYQGAAPPPRSLSTFYKAHRRVIRGTYSVIIALIVWELIGRYVLTSKIMFAPFSVVMAEFVKLWSTGELPRHMLVSFTELAVGTVIAAALGLVIGSLIAISDAVGEHLDPLINGLYATPLVAFSPILILVFGIGPPAIVAIVFLLAVFPIIINTTVGIRSTDASLIEAARSFGASRLEIFRLVLLPSALPFIVAGLRLAIGRGLVAIFIGELTGAREGLGYLISVASQVFNVPAMFVGILVLAASGVIFVAILEFVEVKIAPWRHLAMKA